jgi:hypothetical protein
VSYSSTVLADSPLAYYRLGDLSGATMTDSSGSARNGSYQNAPTLGAAGALTGDTDKSVTFNGGTQFCDVPYAAWMNVAAMTVEAWVKTTDTTNYKSIWDRDSTNSTQRVFQFRKENTNKLGFIIIAGANPSVVSSRTISDGNWHHVACTYDGANLRLYVDGAADGVTATTQALTQPTATNLRLAVNLSVSGGTAYWNGGIDEAAFYGTALSATRIQAHYNAGTAAAAAGFKGWGVPIHS